MWPQSESPGPGDRGRSVCRDPFPVRAARWLRRLALSVLIVALLGGAGWAGRQAYRFTTTSEFFCLKPSAITISGL